MTNLLIEILDRITVNDWCFGYNGACSTCGMMDVKNELKKYSMDEIIEGFESIDFAKIGFQKNIVGLEKLFSLITGPHAVWSNQDKIKRLKKFLASKQNSSHYFTRLLKSDYRTFWDQWSLEQLKWEEEMKVQSLRAKERRKFESILTKNDIEDRKRGARKKLIERLDGMSSYDKLLVLANDTNHSPKFYPKNMAYQITDADIERLDLVHYDKLLKMFSKYIKRQTPWGGFKQRLISGINLGSGTN